jgi:AraC-like DNA-binding protein
LKSVWGIGNVLSLNYVPPPADLSEFLTAFYLFSADEAELNELERADVAQFRLVLAGEGFLEFPDGTRYAFTPCSLIGPRTMASRIVAHGPIRVFGAGLLAPGWATLTGLDATAYTNKMVDGVALMGPQVLDMHRAVLEADNLDQMAEIGITFARGLRRQADGVPLWFTRAVDRWLTSGPKPVIAELIADTGLTRRQIDKLTKQLYGSTPGLLVRKYRALRTANALARGDAQWQNLAAESYYDQSHLIRELKEFTGITPRAIQEEGARLSRLTFGRAALAGKISPLVSDS